MEALFKNQKSLLVIVLFIFLQGNSFSQDDKTKTLKLYSNFNFIRTHENQVINLSTNKYSIERGQELELGYLSPALMIELGSGNFHEFELSRFRISFSENEIFIPNDSTATITPDDGFRKTKALFSARYEYVISLKGNQKASKFHPYLGLSVSPYFEHFREIPFINTSFPRTINQFGTLFSVVPRLNYSLKGNWFLDLNIPIQMIDVNAIFRKNEDPVLPEENRVTSDVNLNFSPLNVLVRFGVGIRI